MPLISIVVPVYKVKEDYLRQCLDSLVGQTFKNIEIILVDDGTPDNGGVICDQYASLDKRIKVIHQKNQGVSAARNNGMKVATGEWITFVDADDWIELDTCEKLKYIIKQNEMDILLYSLKVNYDDRVINNPFWNENFAYLNAEDRDELQIQMLHKSISKYAPPISMVGVAVCKLYKTEFIREKGLEFNRQLALSEDGVFLFWALELANNVFYVDEPLYHYRRHSESATNQYRINAESDYIKGARKLRECLQLTNKGQRHLRALNYRIILNIFAISNQLHCNKKNKKTYFKKIRDIRNLCNTEPYKSAIKETDLIKYFRKNGITHKLGFIFIKLKAYFTFYLFIKSSNKLRQIKKYKKS